MTDTQALALYRAKRGEIRWALDPRNPNNLLHDPKYDALVACDMALTATIHDYLDATEGAKSTKRVVYK